MDPLEILESRCQESPVEISPVGPSQGCGADAEDPGDAKPRVKSIREFTYASTFSQVEGDEEEQRSRKRRSVPKESETTSSITHIRSRLKVLDKLGHSVRKNVKTDEYGRRLRESRQRAVDRPEDGRRERSEVSASSRHSREASTSTVHSDVAGVPRRLTTGEAPISAIDRMALRREELLKKHSQNFIKDVKLTKEAEE